MHKEGKQTFKSQKNYTFGPKLGQNKSFPLFSTNFGPFSAFNTELTLEFAHMELHLSVVVIIVHTEVIVVGQYVEQLPLSLVHEDALVLPELLGAPHQSDVDVINCGSKTMMGAA